VSWDDHFGSELLQGADGVRDDRLEQRAIQVEPADWKVRLIMSGHAPLICSALLGEQSGLAAVPDEHEQSSSVVVGCGDQAP